jgi:hypothetical protein
MVVWQALLWGAFGGLAVEALDLSTAIRRCGKWPWKRRGEPDLAPYLTSIFIRTSVGGGLAAAAAASHQVTTVFAAVTTGVAAPLILENMAKSHKTIPEPAETHVPQPPKTATRPRRAPGTGSEAPSLDGIDRTANGTPEMPAFSGEFAACETSVPSGLEQRDLTALEDKAIPQRVGDVDA